MISQSNQKQARSFQTLWIPESSTCFKKLTYHNIHALILFTDTVYCSLLFQLCSHQWPVLLTQLGPRLGLERKCVNSATDHANWCFRCLCHLRFVAIKQKKKIQPPIQNTSAQSCFFHINIFNNNPGLEMYFQGLGFPSIRPRNEGSARHSHATEEKE